MQNPKNFACGALNELFLPVLARRRRKILQNRVSASDFYSKMLLETAEKGALRDGRLQIARHEPSPKNANLTK